MRQRRLHQRRSRYRVRLGRELRKSQEHSNQTPKVEAFDKLELLSLRASQAP